PARPGLSPLPSRQAPRPRRGGRRPPLSGRVLPGRRRRRLPEGGRHLTQLQGPLRLRRALPAADVRRDRRRPGRLPRGGRGQQPGPPHGRDGPALRPPDAGPRGRVEGARGPPRRRSAARGRPVVGAVPRGGAIAKGEETARGLPRAAGRGRKAGAIAGRRPRPERGRGGAEGVRRVEEDVRRLPRPPPRRAEVNADQLSGARRSSILTGTSSPPRDRSDQEFVRMSTIRPWTWAAP